ncbi:hypothetical protein IHE26_04715 [Plesiomonas shigelloides]|uniref:NifB/NifX family molybdenum-iron cluster-binding protein n=1 Tax=Plesiomonas shigelloides TaxID=703 RepID=UPI0017851845|nr:NifB/NifX family molybdenum-iron cluster-binding protein [Plesiomonas shigelloides]QOH80593.1 hypothetical protein IHE26_04715 [Plesiomonas shigelloides]
MTITAIPLLNDGSLSGHFARALRFALYSPQGEHLSDLALPPLSDEGHCQRNHAVLLQLKQQGVNRVVVSRIGQKMLGKLLAAGLRVYQANRRAMPEALLNAEFTELTSAEQGSVGPNQRASKSHGGHCSGGACHNHSHTAHPQQACCHAAKGEAHSDSGCCGHAKRALPKIGMTRFGR